MYNFNLSTFHVQMEYNNRKQINLKIYGMPLLIEVQVEQVRWFMAECFQIHIIAVQEVSGEN